MLKLLAAALAVFLCAGEAWAQMSCDTRDNVVKLLGSAQYKESLAAGGVLNKNLSPDGILELFLSESGSFTVLYTRSNGVSCIIAAGQKWKAEAPKGETL